MCVLEKETVVKDKCNMNDYDIYVCTYVTVSTCLNLLHVLDVYVVMCNFQKIGSPCFIKSKIQALTSVRILDASAAGTRVTRLLSRVNEFMPKTLDCAGQLPTLL